MAKSAGSNGNTGTGTRGRGHLLALFALSLATVAAGMPPAMADARLCRQLEAELGRVGRGGGDRVMLRKYDRAIEAQADQIERARAIARRGGCAGLFSLFGTGPRCAGISGTLAHMQRNMAMLQTKRDRIAAGAAPGRSRQAILAALEAHDCRTGGVTTRRLPPPVMETAPAKDAAAEQEAYAERLPGGIVIHRSEPPPDEDGEPAADGEIAPPGSADLAGAYSTLCVRTCDGYYFPISYATTADNFARDEQACRARCPGADAHLYFHRVPGEESEDMVSLSGVPYTALPTAFLYRRTDRPQPQGCGCQTARGTMVLHGGDLQESGSVITQKGAPPSADAKTTSEPPPAAVAEDPKRKVRVVGPTFLPDPSAAIDLKDPGRSEVR